MRFGIDGADISQAGVLTGCYFDLNLLGDGSGDFGLTGEDVAKMALVALCPQMAVVEHVDQSNADTYAVAFQQHRTFYHNV